MLSEWKQQCLSIIVGITRFRSIISSNMYYYTCRKTIPRTFAMRQRKLSVVLERYKSGKNSN